MSQNRQMSFVPTTNVWDVGEIQDIDVTKPEFKELLVRLYQNLNNMANAVNIKDTGFYSLQEYATGQQFFSNPAFTSKTLTAPAQRSVFRMTYYITNLPAGVTTVPHNISVNSQLTFVNIYGVANDTVGFNYYPLPFASAAGATNIELRLDGTNIIITNNSGVTFNKTYIVVEYIKT